MRCAMRAGHPKRWHADQPCIDTAESTSAGRTWLGSSAWLAPGAPADSASSSMPPAWACLGQASRASRGRAA